MAAATTPGLDAVNVNRDPTMATEDSESRVPLGEQTLTSTPVTKTYISDLPLDAVSEHFIPADRALSRVEKHGKTTVPPVPGAPSPASRSIWSR